MLGFWGDEFAAIMKRGMYGGTRAGNETSGLGLTGAYSPHLLRYAWAQDAIRHYLSQGFSKKEAPAMTTMGLGHGDGRGRYVAQVYGRQERLADSYWLEKLHYPLILL